MIAAKGLMRLIRQSCLRNNHTSYEKKNRRETGGFLLCDMCRGDGLPPLNAIAFCV